MRIDEGQVWRRKKDGAIVYVVEVIRPVKPVTPYSRPEDIRWRHIDKPASTVSAIWADRFRRNYEWVANTVAGYRARTEPPAPEPVTLEEALAAHLPIPDEGTYDAVLACVCGAPKGALWKPADGWSAWSTHLAEELRSAGVAR